ncbi:MAG: DUF6090 family protein [Flavobacteriaceae bacterium]|nr:DUF6090 family protein [Flavobacteriaceae bacterium]
MVKFFRKIRHDFLLKNRLAKYLLYAIGEIILVVIGILIALEVNNQNEQRKAEAKVEIIFADIMEELTADIEKTTALMRYYRKRDSIIYLVLNDQIKKQDYENTNSNLLWHLTGWYDTVNLSNDAYINLTRNLDAIPHQYKGLLKDLSVLYNRLKVTVDRNDRSLGEMIEENSKIQMRNYSWYPGTNESHRQDQLEYMLNDFRYKNEVEGFRNKAINNQLRWAIRYREHAVSCYQQIAQILNKPMHHESFIVDMKIAEPLIGKWQSIDQPDDTFTFYLKDKRLYGKNAFDDHWEIFCLAENTIVDTDRDYATLVKEKDEMFLVYNSGSLKKID